VQSVTQALRLCVYFDDIYWGTDWRIRDWEEGRGPR
jgi:hypothetical protein